LKRFGPFPHCRQRYERNLRRVHAFQVREHARGLAEAEVAAPPDEVWRQFLDNLRQTESLVRQVCFRTRVLNVSRAFGALRRLSPSFEMLKPRNLRSSGRATALFVSRTFSRSFVVRNRVTEAITRSPARARSPSAAAATASMTAPRQYHADLERRLDRLLSCQPDTAPELATKLSQLHTRDDDAQGARDRAAQPWKRRSTRPRPRANPQRTASRPRVRRSSSLADGRWMPTVSHQP
jgi:hypothetical protein